jgi:drug/metabolite transporter (DMT)-like permease
MNRLGIAYAVIAAALFGIGGTLAQFLFTQRGVSLDWLVTMRLLVSGILLLAFAGLHDIRRMLAVWRDGPALLLFGLLGMLGVQYTYMAAIAASNTATATVLQYTAPAMVALWLTMRRRQLPDLRELGAIALALAGTFFLVTHGNVGKLNISPAALWWGIASAVTAAFNAIQPGALLRRHGAARVTGWGMLIGGVALSFRHPPWRIEGVWDAKAIVFVTFILLVGTLLAFYLSLKALQMIGAQKSSLLSCAEPLSAAILAVWWLGVPFGAMDWLGMALILGTIVLLSREQSAQTLSEHIT